MSSPQSARVWATSRRRTAIINLAFHYVSILLTITQGILLTPLYLSKISVEVYGAWLATGNVLAWIEMVDPGLSSIIQQRVAFISGTNETDKLLRTMGSGFVLSLALSVIPLAALPLSSHIAGFVNLTGPGAIQLEQSFKLGVIGTSVALASYGVTAINIGLQRAVGTGIVYTSSVLIGLVSTVALLLSGHGLASIPLGLLIRSALFFVGNLGLLLVWCLQYVRRAPSLDFAEMREIAGVSAYNFVSRLGATLLGKMDAFLTAHLISPSAAAVLTLTGRPFDIIRLGTERVGTSLVPGLSQLAGEGRTDRALEILRLAGRVVGWVMALGVGVVAALNAQLITLWLGPSIYGGRALTIALGCATAASVLTGLLNQSIFAVGEVRKTAGVGLAEAAVKLPIQAALAWFMGVVGVPLGGVIATLVVSGMLLPILAEQIFGVPRTRLRRDFAFNLGLTFAFALLGFVGQTLINSASLRLGWTWTWPRLCVAGGSLGLALSLIPLALDPEVRPFVARIRNRLPGARRPIPEPETAVPSPPQS